MSKRTQRVYEEKEQYRKAAKEWQQRYIRLKKQICNPK